MGKSGKRKRRGAISALAFPIGCLALAAQLRAQPAQRIDEAQVEAALQDRLKTNLDTLVGPERTIVQVDVTLLDRLTTGDLDRVKALSRMPGVRTAPAKEEAELRQRALASILSPVISSMHVTVWVDESLSEEMMEKIKSEVPKWARLIPGRGDTFKIEPIPWREIVSPPSASQQNYLLYSLLALVALLILIAAIYFPMRKLKTPEGAVLAAGAPGAEGEGAGGGTMISEEERKRKRSEELEEMKQIFAGAGGGDYGEVLSEIRNMLEEGLAKTPGTRIDSILGEIKEILTKSPQEADSLLSEIRDTMADMLDEQRKIAATSGRPGPGGPGEGAASAAAPAAGVPTGREGAAGSDFGPEMVEVLGNIEDLMAQQVEKTPEQGVLDEPFKYLKTLPPEDITMLIEDEEPKLAAAVLSQIDPKAAADVLEVLEENKQFEIAQAMSGLTEEEDLAEEIKSFLERKLKIVRLHKDYVPVLGYRVLADILSSSRYAVTKLVLKNIESRNAALAGEIRKRMFLFEDIVTLEDKDLETVIHNLPREMISYSLVDASEEVKNKVLQNMTERAREMIGEDLETFKKVELEKEGEELPFNEAMLQLEHNVIEEIFRTVDRNILKMALRGASVKVQEKFFSGLTERAVAMLKEDLEVMGAITRKRADEAQEEIMEILRKLSSQMLEAQHEVIATIRKLEREGQITVARFQEEMV